MKKKKLELKKRVIASLSDGQKSKIMGGDDTAYTTSFTNCTHFLCCGDCCGTSTIDDTFCCTAECPDTAEQCPDTTNCG